MSEGFYPTRIQGMNAGNARIITAVVKETNLRQFK